MRGLIYRTLAYFGAIFLSLGTAIPWIISNTMLPLWVDVVILLIILFVWIELARHLVRKIMDKIEESSHDGKSTD